MNGKRKSTIDRLEEFMQHKSINDNKITKLAGLSVGLIGRARKNRTGLHTDTIEKILFTFPELNPTWLLTGAGNMLLYEEKNKNGKTVDINSDSLISEIFKTQREIVRLLKKQYFKK